MPRPRKPVTAHIADGTFRKDRHGSRAEPEAQGEPIRPADLRGLALAYWNREVPRLVANGTAKEQDTAALAELCDLYARQKRLAKLHDDDPVDKETRCAYTAMFDRWFKMAVEFGLVGARSRTRIQVEGEEAEKGDERELKFFSGTA